MENGCENDAYASDWTSIYISRRMRDRARRPASRSVCRAADRSSLRDRKPVLLWLWAALVLRTSLVALASRVERAVGATARDAFIETPTAPVRTFYGCGTGGRRLHECPNARRAHPSKHRRAGAQPDHIRR